MGVKKQYSAFSKEQWYACFPALDRFVRMNRFLHSLGDNFKTKYPMLALKNVVVNAVIPSKSKVILSLLLMTLAISALSLKPCSSVIAISAMSFTFM